MKEHPQEPDHAVREIEATAPRLRPDVRWTFQEVRGQPGYLLEDPVSGRFFRLGEREHRFVSSLDGRRSVSRVVADQAAESSHSESLDPSEAVTLIRALIDSGLVVADDSEHAHRVHDELNRNKESAKVLGRAGQVLFLRIPLCNPDAFFSWLARRLGWLATPGFAVVWLVTIAWGIGAVSGQWGRFSDELHGVFNVGNLWLLGLLWLALKAFHECWHGLVCRRYGGAVPECGVTLLLMVTPLGFVNATSSTAFPSKWQRMFVSAAGMYGELFLAALAAIWWAGLAPGPLSAALHQVIVISSVTTVLFNANPLMRFDGYYLLADFLEIPNLYSKGQKMAAWLAKRWILGIPKARFPLHPAERHVTIAVYGIAAFFWRILVITGLLYAASRLFHGVGLLLTVVAGVAILAQAAASFVTYLRKSAPGEGASAWQLGWRATAFVMGLGAILFFVRVTPAGKAPAVVRSSSGGEVRAACPGFLAKIVVRDGDVVKRGDLLGHLENAEETARFQQLEVELRRSRLRSDLLLANGSLATWQAEGQNVAALTAQVRELRDYVSTLKLRAPRGGIVFGSGLESLRGQWIESGNLILAVGDPDRLELVILAATQDAEFFRAAKERGGEIAFRPTARRMTRSATISRMTPTATLTPPHFALIAPGGGPITVRQRATADPSNQRDHPNRLQEFSLVEPRFQIRANLAPEPGTRLFEGETGWVLARASKSRTLAAIAGRRVKEEIRRFQQRARSHP